MNEWKKMDTKKDCFTWTKLHLLSLIWWLINNFNNSFCEIEKLKVLFDCISVYSMKWYLSDCKVGKSIALIWWKISIFCCSSFHSSSELVH